MINEIPLTPVSQTFAISIGGKIYTFTVRWNAVASFWMIDLGDENNNPLVQGIPMVTGVDLLAQYQYLQLGFGLRVQTDNSPDAIPTGVNLGGNAHLYVIQ